MGRLAPDARWPRVVPCGFVVPTGPPGAVQGGGPSLTRAADAYLPPIRLASLSAGKPKLAEPSARCGAGAVAKASDGLARLLPPSYRVRRAGQ